ncbi:MAG: putative glycoside hydrolase [Patescibacteria group bacterium]
MKRLGFLLLLVFILWPLNSEAAGLKSTYPRLANYFLKWEISEQEAIQLAKWDLLVLDMEVQENNPESIALIRELNPQVIILAYITSQEIIDDVNAYAGRTGAFLRGELRDNIYEGWWLKDQNGNRISNWPYTYMLNLSDVSPVDNSGRRFNDYLPEFIAAKIKNNGIFDGVFYDNTWGDISWINGGNLDLNDDGLKDDEREADFLWAAGFKKMLDKTRALLGDDFIIAGNGRIFEGYQKTINGMMLESFPSTWENGGTWSGSMTSYLKFTTLNRYPQIPIINVNRRNEFDFRALRFGLTSTLLGDGFYSFDYDTTNHSQAWWYDEYDVNLGSAKSQAYNLLDFNDLTFKPGLWRRDFKFGSVLVNSTDKEQLYIFKKEEFEKIKGIQDAIFNNGTKISFLKLPPKDGALVLRSSDLITNSVFINGYFYRAFNLWGEQMKNGYFSYLSAYPAGEKVIISDDQANSSEDISLFAKNGQIIFNKNGKSLVGFYPYDKLFRKQLNLAAEINGSDLKLIVTGPTLGGGPQIMVFLANGKLKYSFFAYDKKSRGGVNLSLADVDGDGAMEIITGPGKGDEPLIKIFSISGTLKSSFFAYDKKFKGGVDVAAGDVNGDGQAEIITGPGQGGGPHVKIFNMFGQMLSQFFAYDKKYSDGLQISLSDVNHDGQLEILTGIKNFY